MAMILAISHVTRYSPCAYQWLFIDSIVACTHPSSTLASLMLSLLSCLSHLLQQNTNSLHYILAPWHGLWANQTVKVCRYRQWAVELLACCCCCCCMAMANSHLVSTGAVTITLQSTELGLWPGADSLLTVCCVGGTHRHEHEWSYTGCAARSLTRFKLAFNSHENDWSIGVLLVT